MPLVQSNTINKDTERAIERVRFNGLSVSGLNLEKLWGLSLPRDKTNSGRLPFNKNSRLKFHKFYLLNGTIHSSWIKPNPSQGTFGYCSRKQDAKECYWRQQLCQMKRDISVRPTKITGPVKVDHLQRWSQICWSDQSKMVCSIFISNRNSGIFIGNSMISSDILHKYNKWYFKIVICNFLSR